MCVKVCIYCKLEKPFEAFPKHSHKRDKLDNRCRECIKQHSKIRAKLKKNAPPKPEACECCGVITTKLCLDHDHKTHQFRGWLCDPCNIGIGKLGDTIEGIQKGIIYLEKCYGRATRSG
jgi:hypothetical protein